jgi:autotransporter-associated beta strand protein
MPSFKPPIGTSSFLILANDGAEPIIGNFAGLPEGARTELASDFGSVEVSVTYQGGDGNDVVLVPLNNFSVWDGEAAPANTNWSNPTNWIGNAVPALGDSVLFPAGAAGLTNFNDLTTNLFFRTIRIEAGGYDIRGAGLITNNTFQAFNPSGQVAFEPGLRAGVNPYRITNAIGGTLTLKSTILHPGSNVELNPEGTMVLNSPLDVFVKRGVGVLQLPVANPSLTDVTVNAGTIEVLQNAALGSSTPIVNTAGRLALLGGRNITNQLILGGELSGIGSGTSNRWAGRITSSGTNHAVNVASNSLLTLAGEISHNLTKRGPGQLFVSGPGTQLFSAAVNEGGLFVQTAQQFCDVTVNAGGLLGGVGQILAQVSRFTNNAGGVVSPGGPNTPGLLLAASPTGNAVFQSGSIFRVRINGANPGTGYSQLGAYGNGAGAVVLNNPSLEMQRTFTPTNGQSFMILEKVNSGAIVGTFAGLPEGAVFINGDAAFQISYVGGNGNDVVLTAVTDLVGASVWTGAGTNSLWTNPANWLGNVSPSAGQPLVFPAGAARRVNTNDFPADTLFDAITLASDDYALHGSAVRLNNGIHANLAVGDSALHLPVTLNQAQTFTNSGPGTLTFFGPIDNNGHTLTLNVASGTNTFQTGGTISGAGGLIKTGAGTLRFAGTTPNTYAGTTTVNAGIVELAKSGAVTAIPGSLVIGDGVGGVGADVVRTFAAQQIAATSQVSLASSGWLDLAGGAQVLAGLTGNGNVITDTELTVNPAGTNSFSGNIAGGGSVVKGGAGVLVFTGTNTYAGPTTVGAGTLQVDGTQPTSPVYVIGGGRLQGSGTVGAIDLFGSASIVAPGASPGVLTSSNFNANLTGTGTLSIELNGLAPGSGYDQLNVRGSVTLTGVDLAVARNFNSLAGSQFVLINNDASDPIVGTFVGKPEGGTFTVGGVQFLITYAGGDGNDVALTQISGPVALPPAIPLSFGAYAENFDSLAGSGSFNGWTNNATLIGWYAAQSASPFAITNYGASTGTDTAGALYSFGAASSSERALGSIASGTPGTFAYGLCFTNDTAGSVGNFIVSYTGEQWRSGGTGSVTNILRFWYRVSGAAITDPAPGVTSGWTEVSGLNFASPVVIPTASPLDGNQPTNRQVFSSVVIPGLVVAPANCVFFRWRDLNESGADQGLSVDDLMITFGAPPVASPAQFTGAAITNGLFQLSGAGTPGANYTIQTATNLQPPIMWSGIGSVLANGSGAFSFTDTNLPSLPMRFYRAVNP